VTAAKATPDKAPSQLNRDLPSGTHLSFTGGGILPPFPLQRKAPGKSKFAEQAEQEISDEHSRSFLILKRTEEDAPIRKVTNTSGNNLAQKEPEEVKSKDALALTAEKDRKKLFSNLNSTSKMLTSNQASNNSSSCSCEEVLIADDNEFN